MAGTADSVLIREVHVLVCPLVRFHFNILYNSGTVVGAIQSVSGQALERLIDTTELLADA